MRHGGWGFGGHGGSFWWILMVLMMVAFWGVLVWVFVSFVRRPHAGTGTAGAALPPPPVSTLAARPTAQEILAERLARGEIEPGDYLARIEALKQTAP